MGKNEEPFEVLYRKTLSDVHKLESWRFWLLALTGIAIITTSITLEPLPVKSIIDFIKQNAGEPFFIAGLIGASSFLAYGVLNYRYEREHARLRKIKAERDAIIIRRAHEEVKKTSQAKETDPLSSSSSTSPEIATSTTMAALHTLRENSKLEAEAHTLLQSVQESFGRHSKRLLEEVRNISIRGNFNLAVGFSIAWVGAYYLAKTSDQLLNLKGDTAALWAYSIPRVTTAIFLELFAFFFLRLYRSCLTQAEHYHAEITRIATIHTALEAAIDTDDKSMLFKTVQNILQSQLSNPRIRLDSNEPKLDPETVKKLLELVPKG